MIIDSHAHYAHRSYQNSFRFLNRAGEGYCICEGSREDIFREMEHSRILFSIEPGITLESNEDIRKLCEAFPGRVFPSVGLHPTRSPSTPWADRSLLDRFAREPNVIAIGETGLDYHHPREQQHRLRQILWFLYQLNLSRKLQLPLILHVRQAHEDAIRILKHFPGLNLGGVVHCFGSGWDIAAQYLDLGYHLGIGGAVLQSAQRAQDLWEAVRRMPLERILIETDSPYILPDCRGLASSKVLRKTRNTSLILPDVINKIAQLKQLPPREVEAVTISNAIRLFKLPIENGPAD